ncbi:autotransporter domain-containing protein [Achromobacter xylosoxidans]|uniref:autotransporter domain-containing protein n=1 Tax=Alcaligenes xylosoxydans xylosoxydans TaxID=85698 RepID=UPI00130DD3C5|nr:autotransporter domain-containing protein [Achromobacter xylosoxidans]
MSRKRRPTRPPKVRQGALATHAALLALGQAVSVPAQAQSYVNYDGTRTNNEQAAVASWANHPEFKGDWGLSAMNAQYAYARGLSGAGVKLGAVDSGYLPSHREFASRGIIALSVKGTYMNDGEQLDGSKLAWRAGEAFDRAGAYVDKTDLTKRIGANDNHGNHVSGTIAAAKNGQGMMGVSFGSQYYTTNSNGTDSSRYGSNMDYNYFKAAYGNLAAAGVRVINSSWGSPPTADNYDTLSSFTQAYLRLNGAGKKTWLDAAADVSLQYGVLHVWANGNAGVAHASTRAGLPYFRLELEKYWITATGLKPSGDQGFNKCGLAKYWCLAAPGYNILSANVTGDDKYKESNGTSMSAPHVTGALGILMERYPYLGNEEIRTILLTTASHRGTGPADTPNEVFGWGVPDLRKGMEGPAQLLGKFTANLPAGVSDTWKNNISEAALAQRRREETEEIKAWTAEKSALQSGIKAVPNAIPVAADVIAGMAQARALLEEVIKSNVKSTYTSARFKAAMDALQAAPQGPLLLSAYEAANPKWSDSYSKATDYDTFIAGRNDSDLAAAAVNGPRIAAITRNKSIQDQIDLRQGRVNALAAKTDADYRGSLVKAGAGTLVLLGDNSYSGGTQLREGTLGVGHNNALGTGALAIANGATLQAVADDLTLANTIALTGLGNVDTQARTLTLTGALTDGQAAGGLAKLGTGTLVLTGASTYSGPTLLLDGTLRAGSAGSFSSRSAFMLNAGTQLDLGGRDQAIGSLSGGGAVALGAATLTTGADNQHSVYTGWIQGTGGLTKTGAGVFTLGADNSAYRGQITVSGGGLWLRDDARLGASVLARTGALLGGTGTLGATTIEAGAVHAPGNPVGTQTITGDYVNRGTLRASGAPSAVSRVDVAGGVDITGATLELQLSPMDAAAWQPLNGPYTLIAKDSPGPVKGEFTTIRTPLLFLDAPVSTTGGDGNDVTLALKRNDRGMASLASTANQASTAAAIDALPQSHEVWRTIALSNSVADLNPALAQLSGDTHASVASALAGAAMAPASLNGLAALRHNLSAPMQPGVPTAAADNGAPPPASALPRSGASPVWIQLGGEWRNLAGDGNAPNLTQRSTSLTIGGDAAVGGGWRMGGAFGYTDARLSAQARQASAKTDSYSATVYGGKAYALGAGALKLMAGGAYSWHVVDSQRQVRYGSLDQRLSANYRGATTQLFTEVGYALPLSDAAGVEPFIGLAWNQLRMRAFSESGGSAALSSDGQRQRNVSSLAGLRGNWLVPGSSIALRGMVGWRHVYGDTRPSVALSFDQGPAFSVAGAPIARDAARVELGADLVQIRNMTAGLSYGGEFGGGNRQHAASLDVRWRF